MDSTLGSASPSPSSVAAIEQNDSSWSPQIDETDTDSRNEGKIAETTTIIPALTPSLPVPSTLLSDEETCGTQDNVDELDEIIDQLDPQSDASEPPRTRSQSQLIGPIRSQTLPSVVQNNIVYRTTIISNVGNTSRISQAFRNVSEVSTNVSQVANTISEVFSANSAASQRHPQRPTAHTPPTFKKKNKTKKKTQNVPAPPRKSDESRDSESDEEESPSSRRPQQWNSDSDEEEPLPSRTPRRWNEESDEERPSSRTPRQWNSDSDEEERPSLRTPRRWSSDSYEEHPSSRRWNSDSDEEHSPSRRPRRWNSESDEDLERPSSRRPRRWNSEDDEEERPSSRTPQHLNEENDEEERPSSLTPRQYPTPLQQCAPNTPPMYSGIPSQLYGPSQGVERPQPHSPGPTQPSIVPAQFPRTSGESWNSERSSSLAPQQYTIPLQQSAPTTPGPPMLSGIPYQPYGPSSSQSVQRPQPHSSRPIQLSIFPEPALSSRTSCESWNSERSSSLTPQQQTRSPLQQSAPSTPSMHSESYHLPSAPTPQGHSMFPGVSQPFVSQTSGLHFGHIPSPNQTTNSNPQIYRSANGFVASDPFRVTHRNEKVDAPSDGLTFDDIPTAPRRSQIYGNSRSMPTQSRYHAGMAVPEPQTGQPIHTGMAMPAPQTSQPIHTGMAMPTPQTSQPINTGMAMPTPQASQPIYTGTPQQLVYQSTSQFYFLLAGFLKQVYLLLLLRLPLLYFSRVARIFEEADMSLSEIKRMAFETASKGLTHEYEMEMAFESSSIPHAYKSLASTWECFIDSIIKEWKTFNIISVLLLSAILAILQFAANDPLIRYTALFSLICSLISLLYGCMYIVRFGTMRKSYKAAQWALEAKKTKPLIWWNVWIMLAMPVIWLTWSIILFIACIMSFTWRTGVTSTTPPGLSNTGLLVIRIVMSVVLGIGVLYGLLIMNTFQRYGKVMDEEWKRRIDEWIKEEATRNVYHPYLDNGQYPPPHPPDRLARNQRPTPSRYYQPSFGDGYPRNTIYYTPPSTPAYAQPTFVPVPPGSPHSAFSNDASTINRPQAGPNQSVPQPDSWVPQPSLGGTTSAPNPAGATPPTLMPTGPAEEFPPRLITERTLCLILESSSTFPSEDGGNALGLSGLENRNSSGDVDAPDDGNHVRFQQVDSLVMC